MVIVEDLSTFTRFCKVFRASANPLVIPVFADAHFHPLANELCVLYVRTEKESFLLPYCHNEARNLSKDTLRGVQTTYCVRTPFAKVLSHVFYPAIDIFDLAIWHYLKTGDSLEEERFYPRTMKQMLSKFRQQRNVMAAVPLMVLMEYLEAYATYLVSLEKTRPVGDTSFHMSVEIPALTFIEQSGVRVDPIKLVEHYGERVKRQVHNGFVYCDYNPYTTTFRVTNKFGAINFAAINKTDRSRECFISRFENGALVLIDFEAFHVRMIGEMIGFELPSESLHEYFGRQYFGVEHLTDEQYQASKTRTMELLYGQEKEHSDIPYFQSVNKFINRLWTKAQEVGYIESVRGTGRRIYLANIENPYPAKLFNYLLQLTESDITMQALDNLRNVMLDKASKITLYTYDSIIIDYSYDDGKQLIKEIVAVLEQDGKYPVRVHVGSTYHEMRNMTDLVKNPPSAI